MAVGLFYIASGVALLATILVVTRTNALHALIYLIVSLLAVAVIFYLLGAPFAAALEIIVYAAAIMVLFVFVVMVLNLGGRAAGDQPVLTLRHWTIPAGLTLILLAEMIYIIFSTGVGTSGREVGPREVGITLFEPYLLAVELAAVLLLAGLVGAYHLGRRYLPPPPGARHGEDS